MAGVMLRAMKMCMLRFNWFVVALGMAGFVMAEPVDLLERGVLGIAFTKGLYS